jgi:hypothetical protein
VEEECKKRMENMFDFSVFTLCDLFWNNCHINHGIPEIDRNVNIKLSLTLKICTQIYLC